MFQSLWRALSEIFNSRPNIIRGFSLTIASYGTWKSPITSAMIHSGTIGLAQIVLEGENIYWIEMRPEEGGRHVIVNRLRNEQMIDLIPRNFNARTRVHEYGGGAFTVADGIVYFSNFDDRQIYSVGPRNQPKPITSESGFCYADGIVDRNLRRIICICENHTSLGTGPVNPISSVNMDGIESPKLLVSGNDFYSSPRLSPDGKRLAWITWNHPNMPWDGTELWIGEFSSNGSIGKRYRIAGGPRESIFQPEWSPSGILHFVSDRTGWWNLYRLDDGEVETLTELDAEFGRPHWVFGNSTYAFVSENRIICLMPQVEPGIWLIWIQKLKVSKLSRPLTLR